MPRKKLLYPRQSRRLSRAFSPNRRRFLQGTAAAMAGMALSNCRGNLENVQSDGATDASADGSAAGGDSDTLHIYTWANYTDDDMLARFTEKTGYNVIVDTFESNEVMLARMTGGGGDVYSIIYPSDYVVQEMVDLGLLSELDLTQVTGLDNLLDNWKDPGYDPGNAHSIPFAWGTSGLLYNRTVLTDPPTDWDYLWDNQDDLARRITLLDDVRETLGAVLKSLGYSYNSNNPDEIEEAYERLSELRPAIASFMTSGYEDALLGGDLSVVMAYSSDAAVVIEENADFEYIVPESGTSVWTDTIVIPSAAPNSAAAYEWINFILEPGATAKAVERLYFATPNANAIEMLPDEIKSNDDVFPPNEVIARCEGIAPLEEETEELFDRYWTQITGA
ncbi:MAG: spermidine/putrescine ABC transporter substrate-binding protein [Cyanobacteria bacterium P01_D01_bin.128]